VPHGTFSVQCCGIAPLEDRCPPSPRPNPERGKRSFARSAFPPVNAGEEPPLFDGEDADFAFLVPMPRRLEASRAEQLIDEGVVCLVALQGDQAGQSDIVVSALEIIVITSVTGLERCAASRGSRLPGLARFGAVQPEASRRRWARRQSSLAWQLDDRAVPDTVPMKVVPHQCGALGRSRPALTGSVWWCRWTVQPVCSCASGAVCRSSCVAAAIAVTGIAAAPAGARSATSPGARPPVVTSARAADAPGTPRVHSAGANA
jgi:hypothetical protein